MHADRIRRGREYVFGGSDIQAHEDCGICAKIYNLKEHVGRDVSILQPASSRLSLQANESNVL